tara:strand:- start:9 stop:179 length:171 start_codon:yes stop_codon:yes gene_type:complete
MAKDEVKPERWNILTAEESMKLVREEYERRNRDNESWMTRHDREYLEWQKENKWQL